MVCSVCTELLKVCFLGILLPAGCIFGAAAVSYNVNIVQLVNCVRLLFPLAYCEWGVLELG